jgi:hypothetical protein
MATNSLDHAVQERFRAFAKCPQCLSVFDTHGGYAHIMLSNPAPCCGGTGEPRIVWPDTSTALFLAVPDLLADSEHELRQKASSLCSAIEGGLRDILVEILGAMATPAKVAWAYLEKLSGRNDLEAAYRSLTVTAVGDVLKQHGLAEFLTSWRRLVKSRNHFAHGHWYGDQTEQQLADDVRVVGEKALVALAALHNAAVKAVR